MKDWLEKYQDGGNKTSINRSSITQDIPDFYNTSGRLLQYGFEDYGNVAKELPQYNKWSNLSKLSPLVDLGTGLLNIAVEEKTIKNSNYPEKTREEFEREKRKELKINKIKDIFPNPWLENGGKMQEHQPNFNNSSVSIPKDFVGQGYNTKGRNYSPAWGGQFEDGGKKSFKKPEQREWLTDFIDDNFPKVGAMAQAIGLPTGTNPLKVLQTVADFTGVPGVINALTGNPMNLPSSEIEAAMLPAVGAVSSSKQVGEKFYRRLTEGQITKALKERGWVNPTKNEKSLTVTKSFPKKGNYILELQTDNPVDANVVSSSFRNNHPSQTYAFPDKVDLLSGKQKMYKRLGKDLVEVDPRLFGAPNKEAFIDKQTVAYMQPYSGNIETLPIGKEVRVAPNKIYVNPSKAQFSLDDYLFNTKEFESKTFTPNNYITNDFNDPNFKSIFHDNGVNYYRSKNPSTLPESEFASTVKSYINNYKEDIKPQFQDPVTINSARTYYKNHFDKDISMLSNEDISKFIQKSFDESGGKDIIYHSTYKPIDQIDFTKLGQNTGNQGWFGKGLYFSDRPTQDYGLLQEPFIHSGIERPIIINNEVTPRMSSPQKEVDQLLQKTSSPKINVDKNKKFSANYSNDLAPGIGKYQDEWNNFLKKENIDAVLSKLTTKGSGTNFPEILIPESSQVKLKSLYSHPELIKEAINKGTIARNWEDPRIHFENGGLVPKDIKRQYIRHGAPSEGKHAKKTLSSAKDGNQLQNLDQLTNFNNFGQSSKWLDKYK